MRSFVFFCVVTLAACSGNIGDPNGPDIDPPPPFECEAESPPLEEPLRWKRVRALESDLARALSLDTAEVCAEVDRFRCADVHIVPLGGNDPFANAQYEPIAKPMATTPMAVDRMVLAACGNRAALDEAGAPAVFADLVPSDVPVTLGAAVDSQLTNLYRRLLARDPIEDELVALRELAVDDAGAALTTREFDVLSCYAIGTTTEFLFF